MIMHVTFDSLKTFYNILVQKLKNHRGNWNQNDPTADDYIKNRPFYSEGMKETTIVDMVVNFDNSSSDMGSSGPTVYQIMIDDYSVKSFKIGETYTVIWDGQTYKCIAQDISGIGVLGNASLIGYMGSAGYEDTGEPFLIGAEQGYGYIILSIEDGNHTMVVKTIMEIVKKLDKKFIDMPDDIVTGEELDEALNFVYDDMDASIHNLGSEVVKTTSQGLTSTEKSQARTNIGAASNDEVVKIVSQSLTDSQKAQARTNIGAGTSNFSGSYDDLTNVPEVLQADWLMYDKNSNAYIKNKPFGYEYELKTIMKQIDIEKLSSGTLDTNSGLYYKNFEFTNYQFSPNVGNNLYYFIVDGKPNIAKCCLFKATYSATQEYFGIGNAILASQYGVHPMSYYLTDNSGTWYTVKDTGEDWFLLQRSGNRWEFYTTRPDLEITDVYRVLSETFNQLDEKYIPDTIARVSDIPEIPEVPAVLDENGKLLNSVLPYGYPYAEYEFKPITWDGNTEGLVSAGNLYKVSELPENLPADYDFTDANNSPIVFDSVTYRENSRSPIQNGAGVIFVFPNNKMTFGVAFALEAGSKLSISDPIPFPEPGVYFYKSDDGKFVSWFAGAESIHKLRKEFTPEIPTYAFVEFNGLITPHGVETEDQLHNMVHEFANNDVHIMYSNADFSSVPFEEYMPCVNAMLTYNDGSVTLMFVNSSNQVKLKLTPTYDEDYNYTGFTIDKEVLNTGGASKTLNLYACYRDMADDGTAARVPALTPDDILSLGCAQYDDYISITDLVDVEHVVIFEGQADVGVSATVEYHRDNYGRDYATFTFYSEHEERIRIMSSKEFEGTTTPVATEEYVTRQITNLVNSAPDALNTLDELAAALGDDENFATTVTNQIAGKLDASALPTAINDALAQAKASGEFNGIQGEQGEQGAAGYTPVRGTDYWTEADKADIKSYVDSNVSSHNSETNAHSDIRSLIGNLSNLNTTAKDSLVAAINEAAAREDSDEIPYFDLVAMGLPAVPLDGTAVNVEVDCTTLREAMASGLFKVTFSLNWNGYSVPFTSVERAGYLSAEDCYQVSTICHMTQGTDDVLKLGVFTVRPNKIIAQIFTIQQDSDSDVVTVPTYTESDYGKILTATADGLVWADATGGASLTAAEGVAF